MTGDATITVLQRLFPLMNASAGLHAVFSGAADAALTLLEADATAIFAYDEISGAFSAVTARHLSPVAQMRIMAELSDQASANPAWLAYPQMQTGWAAELTPEEDSVADGLPAASLDGLVTMPLRTTKGALLGMLVALYRRPEALTARQQVVASLLGGLTAAALENARLVEEERQRADFLADTLRISDILQVDQSPDSLLQQVVEIIAASLGWQTVVIVLQDFDAGVWRPAAWVTGGPAYDRWLAQVREQPLPAYEDRPWQRPAFTISQSYFVDHRLEEAADVVAALRSGRYFIRPGVANPAPLPETQWHPEDLLFVPLRLRGIELGWIAAACPLDLRRPTLARIQQMEAIAGQLAHALINTRLYNEAEHERIKVTTVLDNMAEGVLAFDLQDRLLFANPAAEQFLGVPLPREPGFAMSAVLAQTPLLEFLSATPRAENRAAMLDMARSRAVWASITPLPHTGRMVVLRDVTTFRHLDNTRLELLSSLSQDLRNPLAAISATASLIGRAGQLSAQQREVVERLQAISQRAASLIAATLEIARLETGAVLEREICLLPEMIAAICDEMAPRAGDKGVILRYDGEGIPVVWGDAARLRQVLVGLIDNAIRYTPAGGQVVISTDADDREVLVCVRDTGVGIPEVHLPYIFDRLYRINPRADAEGAGLGLTVARTVVERHGGRIWADSAEGQGSTFCFTLPLPAA